MGDWLGRQPASCEILGKFSGAAAHGFQHCLRQRISGRRRCRSRGEADNRRGACLKVGLGQLLDQETAPAHVDLGAIDAAVGERDRKYLPAELRLGMQVNAERMADARGVLNGGGAEDVHQQRIGAHGGVEFAPRGAPVPRSMPAGTWEASGPARESCQSGGTTADFEGWRRRRGRRSCRAGRLRARTQSRGRSHSSRRGRGLGPQAIAQHQLPAQCACIDAGVSSSPA